MTNKKSIMQEGMQKMSSFTTVHIVDVKKRSVIAVFYVEMNPFLF